MKKSLIALAFGGLGLGMTEFSMMGVLPDIARSMDITIPHAGHFISAYAVGVSVGAPLLILLSNRFPPKRTLLLLMVLFTVFNTASAFSPNYSVMLIMRFLSGLPHGAFFGVGAVVAGNLAERGHGAQAVATMFAGLTIANLVGVPLGTFIGNYFSWRYTFLMIGAWGLVTLLVLWLWLPIMVPQRKIGLKDQFGFLRLGSSWILFGVTLLGNGGLFAWYSYIMPLMTRVAGFTMHSETLIMVIGGLGMVVGNLFGGSMSERLTPQRTARILLVCLSASLLSTFFLSHYKLPALLATFTSTAFALALSAPMQVLLIRNAAGGGEMLGAAASQVAFNIGNAIGAFCGGLPVEAGLSYTHTALAGSIFAILGFLLMTRFRPPSGSAAPAQVPTRATGTVQ